MVQENRTYEFGSLVPLWTEKKRKGCIEDKN